VSPSPDRDARGETPSAGKKVEALFHAALEREPGERGAFLKEACADDEALLREVTSLLDADERAERFIEQPAVHAATQAVAPRVSTEARPPAPDPVQRRPQSV
jgi:hypothetical protein